MPRSRLAVFLVASIAAVHVAPAQDVRAHVQGIVTDASSAVIAGANVTLVNVGTGLKTIKTTNEAGVYRFDFVDPGTYTVIVEQPGFSKFTQENFSVQAQGDVTVNAVLTPGAIQQTVEVQGNPVEVKFEATNIALTVDTTSVEDVPRFDRNPFKFDLLMPNAVETRRSEMNQYNSWSGNSVDLGGGTNLKNEMIIDGSTIGISYKTSWVPNRDAVQEANIQQNSVDAEFGHSAGGTIVMVTKSGTNDLHGSLFYIGRNPDLNAVTDRTTGSNTATRNIFWGGTIGNRIVKNKLFNFFSIEGQNPRTPSYGLSTLPTALEAQGNFSQSLNVNGALRTIYNPYSTVFNASTGVATRSPFPGNIIPQSMFDPIGAQWMADIAQFAPNHVPSNITGVNNFSAFSKGVTNFEDWSDKVDYYLTDKWRLFGRGGWYNTNILTEDSPWIGNPLYVQGGSKRQGFTGVGDAIYTQNATTVWEFHGDDRHFIDEYYSPNNLGSNASLAKYWPNNPWYTGYTYPPDQFGTYLPGIQIGTTAVQSLGAGGTLWTQHPNGKSLGVKVSHQRESHFLKAGVEFRMSGGYNLTTSGNKFIFDDAVTANTFLSPNTALSGDPWATLLLGVVSNTSSLVYTPVGNPRTQYYAAFIQDDWKMNRRITVNLGLRYDVETPWYDPQHTFSVGPNLSLPNPTICANPVAMPAAVTAMLTTSQSCNGQWQFTSGSNPGMWAWQDHVFMPRLGVALRIDDKTALRFGYGRYVTPAEENFQLPPYTGFENEAFIEPLQPGYGAQQSPLALNAGVPQATISNPFPASNNPLLAPPGNTNGINYGLGTANVIFGNSKFTRPVNDRFNLTLSRQMPRHIVAEATFFANFGHNWNYYYNINQENPAIIYQYQGATAVNVANPYYNYLTPAQFPGPLRNQATIPISDLLVKYPQYGGLWEAFDTGQKERYYSLELKAQRSFTNGWNLIAGYTYIRELAQQFDTPEENYLGQLVWQQSGNPHHRLSLASTYQLPFGKGRPFMNNAPRIVEGALGGWQVVGVVYANSGDYLQFGSANVIPGCDVALSNPTWQHEFNTSCFSVLGPYSPRVNPLQYPNLRGPVFLDTQASLSKSFLIPKFERMRGELKFTAYNLINRLNRADPDTTITDSTFGAAISQGCGISGINGVTPQTRQTSACTTGRQMEFGMKLTF
jgi:Carboxypeptidase regulatory-like domain